MPAAAFESEPQASAAATGLRELGYDCEVLVRGANTFDARTRDFFAGKPPPFEAHAILISDADPDRFVRAVQRHYGVVLSEPAP